MACGTAPAPAEPTRGSDLGRVQTTGLAAIVWLMVNMPF